MVLLQLTDLLDARLRSLELPTELAETLLSHLDHERDEAGGPDNQNDQMVLERPRKGHPSRTIDHSVLVRVARHCRTLKEQSREPGRCSSSPSTKTDLFDMQHVR